MRIIQLVNSLGCGGAENLVINFTAKMQEIGHDVLIVSLSDKVEYDELIALNKIRYYTCGFNGTIYSITSLIKASNKLRSIIIEFKPDVIHSHIFLSDLLARFNKPDGARLITTFHTPEPWWSESRFKSRCKTFIESITARHFVDGFTAVSLEAELAAYRYLKIPKNSCELVPNGVDLTYFAPNNKRHNNQIIIHVGRFYPEKAHDVLLRAFCLVLGKLPKAELWLVGDGPGQVGIKKLAIDLDIAGSVKFLGVRSDVVDLLNQASVFVLPSNREGLPISLLEAMACALPVVVSPVGYMGNIIRDGCNGILVPAGDYQSLSQKIIYLLEDESAASVLGKAARITVEDEYSIESTAQNYLRIYSQVKVNQ